VILDCPICFAESGTGRQPDGYSPTLEEVESMLDALGPGATVERRVRVAPRAQRVVFFA
jgi:uncharacterized radical SAM superfamily Fe-S cluster-containing enzyme